MSLKSNTSKKKGKKNSINTSELSEKQRETQIITSQEKEWTTDDSEQAGA